MLQDVVPAPPHFTHRTPDFGVLPPCRGPLTLRPLLDALLSPLLSLCGSALPFVRTQLPLIGGLLALVRDSVALVGYAFSLVGDALASGQIPLAACELRVAMAFLSSAPTRLARSLGAVPVDHRPTLAPPTAKKQAPSSALR